MAAPQAQLRKHLSAPSLLQAVRESFKTIPEHRRRQPEIPLADALMSGLAMFSLKYPSLLKFDEAYADEQTLRHNLTSLYGVERAPCDTQLRAIADPVEPEQLRGAFRTLHQQVQRGKGLEAYEYWNGHYLVSVDGTGHYASSAVHCPDCCEKISGGKTSYYHQLLGAVIVHPHLKTVLPLMPEAITRQDGNGKNDCERSAAKRLLKGIREDFPKRKLIVVEDSLSSNGPHIECLQSLGFRYILGVKVGDHQALFEEVDRQVAQGMCQEYSLIDSDGVEHGYRWINGVCLNKTYSQLKVNFLEYWEIKDGKERNWSWVTDIPLNPQTVETVMRGGRARWKVENETFNTLKNQGYGLEHNYGHGQQHLATVLAMLMMLAFLIDQIQEHSCRVFQAARARFRSRTSLWERMRAFFTDFRIPDWATLWQAIIQKQVGPVLSFDSS